MAKDTTVWLIYRGHTLVRKDGTLVSLVPLGSVETHRLVALHPISSPGSQMPPVGVKYTRREAVPGELGSRAIPHPRIVTTSKSVADQHRKKGDIVLPHQVNAKEAKKLRNLLKK